MDEITFKFELNSAEAMALAQFVKRVTWADMRGCAVDEDETYLIRSALAKVQESVNDKGFNPR